MWLFCALYLHNSHNQPDEVRLYKLATIYRTEDHVKKHFRGYDFHGKLVESTA